MNIILGRRGRKVQLNIPSKKQGLRVASCFVTTVMLGHLLITPAAFFLHSRVAFAEGEEASAASSADATNDIAESEDGSSSSDAGDSGGTSSDATDSSDGATDNSSGSQENAPETAPGETAPENDSGSSTPEADEAAEAEQNTQQTAIDSNSSVGENQPSTPDDAAQAESGEAQVSQSAENGDASDTADGGEGTATAGKITQGLCELDQLDQTAYFDTCALELACADTDECIAIHGCEIVRQCLLKASGGVYGTGLTNETSMASGADASALSADGSPLAVASGSADGTILSDGTILPAAEAGKSSDNSSGSDGSDSDNESSDDSSVSQLNNPPADAGVTADIATGDAQAAANAYNEININTIGQNILRLIFNIEGTEEGDVDLLEKFSELLELSKALLSSKTYQSNDSAAGAAGIPIIEIENTNVAVLENNITASSESGANQINGTAGDATITTGDTLATANVVNVVNQNYVGNNWLFAMINVYGSWLGDLILPGKDLLKVSGQGGYDLGEIENTNVAVLENNITASSESGTNQISGTAGDATITTGDTLAQSGAVNQVNTNIVKDNWLFLLINNMGSWTGRIVNIDGGNFGEWYEFDFGLDETGEAEDSAHAKDSAGIINVKNQNIGVVTNNVNASATSGGNSIDGTGGDATITTGDAFAMSRVINFINNNIIGDNWLFSVVNVMGNWEGDAVFAYPDLELSISDNLEAARPGQKIDYAIHYKNIGHAPCDAIELRMTLPDDVNYEFESSGIAKGLSDKKILWRLPGLPAGAEGSIMVTGRLKENVPYDVTQIAATAGIKTGTVEKVMDNNDTYDVTRIYWQENGPAAPAQPEADIEYLDDGNGDEVENASLKLTRTVKTKGQDQSGYFVEHSIFLENNGSGPVYNIEVEDKVKNEGQKVITYIWNIGDLAKGKKIRIKYTVHIAAQFGGTYKNTVHAIGYTEAGKKVKAKPASVEITLAQDPALAQSYLEYYYYTGAIAEEGIAASENQENQPAEAEENLAAPTPTNNGSGGGGLPAAKDRNYILFFWLAAVAFTVLRFARTTTYGRRLGKFAGAFASRYGGLVGARLKDYSEDAAGNNTLE